MQKFRYDVVIVGGGIIGGAIAYELSKYSFKTAVLERNSMLNLETSAANQGILHSGFDLPIKKLKGRLQLEGNRIWRHQLFALFDFPKMQTDSLMVAFNQEELEELKALYQQGLENGIEPETIALLSKEKTLQKEPSLNPAVMGGLISQNSWTMEAVGASDCFYGAALSNGLALYKNQEVAEITFNDGIFTLQTSSGHVYEAKIVINAAGHGALRVAEIAGYADFSIKRRRGEFRQLASQHAKGLINNICFSTPKSEMKALMCRPMVSGNVLVGPTAEENIPLEDIRVFTKTKFDETAEHGRRIVPILPFDKPYTAYASTRSIIVETDDFHIKPAATNPQFINLAGIQSPGITSSPAIALFVKELVAATSVLEMNLKPDFKPSYKLIY